MIKFEKKEIYKALQINRPKIKKPVEMIEAFCVNDFDYLKEYKKNYSIEDEFDIQTAFEEFVDENIYDFLMTTDKIVTEFEAEYFIDYLNNLQPCDTSEFAYHVHEEALIKCNDKTIVIHCVGLAGDYSTPYIIAYQKEE